MIENSTNYADLDNQKEMGELNITVIYHNGVPSVVKNGQSTVMPNQSAHHASFSQSKN